MLVASVKQWCGKVIPILTAEIEDSWKCSLTHSPRSKTLEYNQSGRSGKVGLGRKMPETGSKGSCGTLCVSEKPAFTMCSQQKCFLEIESDSWHFVVLLVDVDGAPAPCAYPTAEEACRAHKVRTNAWWLTGWLERRRYESGGQTVSSRWSPEEEQEVIQESLPQKNHRLSITCIKQCWEEAKWKQKRTKKSFFSNAWRLQYLHFIFTNLQDLSRNAWVHTQPPRAYTSHVLDMLEVKTNWLCDSISVFSPSTILSIIFSFFSFWKSLFAAKEKVWVFVINVVEIQICPPQKGVFINSHSPEN